MIVSISAGVVDLSKLKSEPVDRWYAKLLKLKSTVLISTSGLRKL